MTVSLRAIHRLRALMNSNGVCGGVFLVQKTLALRGAAKKLEI
jgi:hypothetical protein